MNMRVIHKWTDQCMRCKEFSTMFLFAYASGLSAAATEIFS